MAKRTFVCLDCKSECECSPVGIVPKRCVPCKKAAKLKDQELRRAAKGTKPRGRRPARAASTASEGGNYSERLDLRIRRVCEEIAPELVEAAVDRLLDAKLKDLLG